MNEELLPLRPVSEKKLVEYVTVVNIGGISLLSASYVILSNILLKVKSIHS
jgi:hypothetical protein